MSIEIVDCQRKNCKFNKWGIISGYHCTATVLYIDKQGKCINFALPEHTKGTP